MVLTGQPELGVALFGLSLLHALLAHRALSYHMRWRFPGAALEADFGRIYCTVCVSLEH